MTALIGIIISYVLVLIIGKFSRNLTVKNYAVVSIIAIITTLIMVIYLFEMNKPEL